MNFKTKTPPLPTSGSVEVVGLGKAYGKHVVLSDVNLTMREGEVVSIIGPTVIDGLDSWGQRLRWS
jgi:ABC-type transporter Mla maintaining outer membrane lipid asymmetry ATPase subunit MlaF